ncbi:MAG: hypothetical protein AB1626_00960 [Candidatus Micrarchaeota archaeon]
MRVKYTRHAIVDSMSDEKISGQEVEAALKKSEYTVRLSEKKFKFRYRDVEVVAQKERGYWLVITCYRTR